MGLFGQKVDNYRLNAYRVKVSQETLDGNTTDVQHVNVDAISGTTTVDGEVKTTTSIGTIEAGRKVVAAAGTAEAIVSSSTPCQKVDIQAELDNTGVVVLGGTGVIADAATRKGIALEAGDTYLLEIEDARAVYIDSTVNGEGVTFTISTTDTFVPPGGESALLTEGGDTLLLESGDKILLEN